MSVLFLMTQGPKTEKIPGSGAANFQIFSRSSSGSLVNGVKVLAAGTMSPNLRDNRAFDR